MSRLYRADKAANAGDRLVCIQLQPLTTKQALLLLSFPQCDPLIVWGGLLRAQQLSWMWNFRIYLKQHHNMGKLPLQSAGLVLGT